MTVSLTDIDGKRYRRENEAGPNLKMPMAQGFLELFELHIVVQFDQAPSGPRDQVPEGKFGRASHQSSVATAVPVGGKGGLIPV